MSGIANFSIITAGSILAIDLLEVEICGSYACCSRFPFVTSKSDPGKDEIHWLLLSPTTDGGQGKIKFNNY